MNIHDKCYKCGYQKANYVILHNGITERFCFRCIGIIKKRELEATSVA